MIDGLKMANGNVSDACNILRQKYNHPIGRSTLYNAIKANPVLAEIRLQAEGQVYDVCDFGVTGRAQAGNPRDQRLVWGKLYSKHGGDEPAQKIEVSGPDGTPVQHQHEIDADGGLSSEQIAALTDAELATLLAAERILYAKRCAIAAASAQARAA